MIKKSLFSIFSTLLLFTVSSFAQAGLVQTFQIDTGNGMFTGNTFTSTLTGLVADGVTFDATITVVGSGDLNQGTGGLGVETDSSDLVSNGEYLQFSMALSNFSGGTVVFNGFQEVDFNNFGATDAGFLSVDNSGTTTGDNFFSTTTGAGNVSFANIASFHAIARADGAGSNSFRIDDVTGEFRGFTAVPEPTSVLMFGSTLLLMVRRKKR